MSTSTPQSLLTDAVAQLAGIASEHTLVADSLGNAAKARNLAGAHASAVTGEERLQKAQGLRQTVLTDVQGALALLNTPPTPGPPLPPPPTGGTVPAGIPGNWSMVWNDEFNGSSLNTSLWNPSGWRNNNMSQGSSAANVTVGNGTCTLITPGPGQGAQIESVQAVFKVGMAIEFCLKGNPDDWWAAWTSGPGWPASGEIDFFEWLGRATTNYHDPAGQDGPDQIPGAWTGKFITVGGVRNPSSVDVYWGGSLVHSLPTRDNGAAQNVILTNGPGNNVVYGPAGAVVVDYVRVFA